MRRDSRWTLAVDGRDYCWQVIRNPQWCTEDGYKGLLLQVQPIEGGGRVLHLQMPFEIRHRRSSPHHQRPTLPEAQLIQHIREALLAGWDPDSNGKPFRYDVSPEETTG